MLATSILHEMAIAVRTTPVVKPSLLQISSTRQASRLEAVSTFILRLFWNVLRVFVVAYFVLKLFIVYVVRRLVTADLSLPPAPRKKWIVDEVIAARQRSTTRRARSINACSAAAGTGCESSRHALSEPSAGNVESAPHSAAATDFSVMCREASVRDAQLAALLQHVRSIAPKGSLVEVSAGVPDLMRILRLAELSVRRDVLLASWKHIIFTPPSVGLPSSTIASLDAVCREFDFDGIPDAVHVLCGGPLSHVWSAPLMGLHRDPASLSVDGT